MGLRTKITLILIAVLLALSSLTVLIMNWAGKRQLDQLEATESNGDMRRLKVSFDGQMQQVNTLLSSWSNWTEFYEHAAKTDPDFVEEELNPDAIRIAQISWLIRITPDATIGDLVEVPQADGTTPLTGTLSDYQAQVHSFLRLVKEKPQGCGVTSISGQLSFVCYRPLHDSSGEGPARGWIGMGRWIGPKILDTIRDQTDLNFELMALPQAQIIAANTAQSAPATQDARQRSSEPVVTRENERLTLSLPLMSIRNVHIGDLRMQWPRRSMANAEEALEQTRNTMLLLLLVTAGVLMVLIDRVVVRRLRRLKDELGVIVGDGDWNGTISATGNDEIAQLAQYSAGLMGVVRTQLVELRDLSSIDTLTALPNRRTFDARLIHVLAQYVRAKRPASLILIDIDHFKRYNDTYGHPAGDAALQKVSECLKTTLRRQLDLAARLGGEEFAIVCDETPLEGAVVCAELVRNAILAAAITHSGNPPLGIMSISLGIATIEDGDSATTLYQRADKALYVAKESGRNRLSTGT